MPADLAGLPLGSPTDARHTLAAEGQAGNGPKPGGVVPLTIDACALHDPQAATQATGLPGDNLQPGRDLNECSLRTGSDDVGWNLYATAGSDPAPRMSPAMQRSGRFHQQQMTIGGLPTVQTVLGLGSCQYTYQRPDGTTLRLSVQRSGGSDQTATPAQTCDIGQRYLEKIAPYWAHPALRGQHATTPEIQLGQGPGPCAGMRELLHTLPPLPGATDTWVEHPDRGKPAECKITDRVKAPGHSMAEPTDRADVTYVVATPPPPTDTGIQAPTQILGRPAGVDNHHPDGCQITTQVGPPIDMNLRSPGSDTVAPEIEATAPTCQAATTASEAAVRASHT